MGYCWTFYGHKKIRKNMEENEIEVLIYGGSGTENPAYRYRVIHLKEQFDIAGIKCQILRNLVELFQLTDAKNKILILKAIQDLSLQMSIIY